MSTEDKQDAKTETIGYQFNTFKGVFTPSILTILGVIMYLRFGWVLGNVGLFKTLLIVTISTAITFLTGLSISALATNMKVGGGGTYFIISRSLGLEAGAAVSLPLYFAQSLGISFYIAGFAESIVTLCPFLSFKVVGVLTLLVLAVLSYISANFALKTQFVILGLVGASLISFFLGSGDGVVAMGEIAQMPSRLPFWVVFAVFFPAVTGIEAGLAMSGDLKNPTKSLPLGTIGAIVCSYIVYMAIPIFLSSVIHDKRLFLLNAFIMKDVAKWGFLIVLGVWGATLSSALGALLGAPRTLQALARDRVVPPIIGKGFGSGQDPRIAVVISFIVAFVGIIAGDLNVIAPILTMFFLTAYGLLNMSAALEGLIGSPSWRPKLRVHWGFSLVGGMLCFVAMLMINPGATFVALFVSLAVFVFMRKRCINASWDDMRYGILMLGLYYIIHRLEGRRPDLKTWRPNLLVLSGPPKSRWHLIDLADAITCKRGLLTISTILPVEDSSQERLENLRTSLSSYIRDNEVRALVNVRPAKDWMSGAQEMVKAYGFGSVAPNTILVGETEKKENFIEYARFIRLVHRQKKNLIIMRRGEIQVASDAEVRMDLLWRGKQKNAGFMLSLAYVIKMSGKWDKTKVILKTIIYEKEKEQETMETMKQFIKGQRIGAEAAVVVNEERKDVFQVIEDNSHGANLMFLGMRPPLEEETDEQYSEYYGELLEKTSHFPTTILVLASEGIEFNRIFSHEK